MTVETTTRPLIVVEDLRPARRHPQRMRRRRVVAGLTVGAAASLGGAGAIGSPQLGVVGAVLALTLALYAAQLLRLRAATVRRELDALQATGWADDDLSTWPTVTAAEIGRRGEAAPPADAGTPPLVARPPRLMDRWAVTQVVWAGVLGCCYNALATLAERLSQGSSLPWLRARLLLVTGRLLARLSGQSWRRTVAISALATASSTGLFVAGTGPIGTAMAGAAQVPSAHRAARATAPAPAEGISSYTVRTGDTLWSIAQRFGTTVGALAAANGLADPTLIYAGQVFTVPRGGAASTAARATTGAQTPAEGTSSYTVRTGDTLWGIAQRFGTTVGALASANGLADPALIYAGQVLAMPQGGAASDATASLTAATGAAPAAPTAASAVTSAPAPTAPVAAVPLAAPAATSAPAPAPAPAATSAPAPAPAPAATSAPAPAPAATSAPATAAAPSSYTVQPGDTLATIAQRFGTTVGALAAANGIADPTVLYAGQVLTISGPGAPAAPAAPSGGATATLTSATTSASTPAASGTTSPTGQAAVQAAESQLGVPYSWGGETAGVGFDCSGLAQWAWSQAGVAIPRTSQAQWTAVPHVSLSNLQPGDLLFYYNLDGTGTVDHVAIYVGSGPDGSQTIIQAPYTGTTVSFAALYTTGLIGAGQP